MNINKTPRGLEEKTSQITKPKNEHQDPQTRKKLKKNLQIKDKNYEDIFRHIFRLSSTPRKNPAKNSENLSNLKSKSSASKEMNKSLNQSRKVNLNNTLLSERLQEERGLKFNENIEEKKTNEDSKLFAKSSSNTLKLIKTRTDEENEFLVKQRLLKAKLRSSKISREETKKISLKQELNKSISRAEKNKQIEQPSSFFYAGKRKQVSKLIKSRQQEKSLQININKTTEINNKNKEKSNKRRSLKVFNNEKSSGSITPIFTPFITYRTPLARNNENNIILENKCKNKSLKIIRYEEVKLEFNNFSINNK